MLLLRKFTAWLCFSLIVTALCSPAFCQTSNPAQPKLIVLLVIDQFNFDYLSRYQDKFGASGFRYLMDNGANFVNCKYKQATTVTAVGHSIIASGAYPWSTGVVANEWFDRRKNAMVSATNDDSVQMVGANGPGSSSKAMYGTTLGDQLKLSTNGRSKVFTISMKDRSALFLGGRLANSAIWWDMRTGNFVSSSQYGSTLPLWVKTFNDQHYADKYFGKPWQRLYAETQYGASTRDEYSYERPLAGDGKQFPHVITGGASSPNEQFYTTFAMTPWGNQMVADLAREAIEKENLGQHTDTDMLGVSFSSTDYLGHAYGPYSQEVEDMMLRLDQTIATLLAHLDQKIGLDRCLIAVTGDHGNMPVPEFLKERGLEGGRIDPKALRTLLDAAMDSRLVADDWISAFSPPNLYLNLDTIDKQKYRQPDVESLASKLAHSVQGVGDVYTAFQFYMNQLPSGPHLEAVRRSYFNGRSGELYVIPKPGFMFSSEAGGTGHGSPFSYDAQVPLLLYGSQVRAGKYGQEASPADIAPTISAILNIGSPALTEGRVLQEALGQIQSPPRPLTMQAARTAPEPTR